MKAILKLSRKALASALILLVFTYITIFINMIPPHFTIKLVDGKLHTTYPIENIKNSTNWVFGQIMGGNLEVEYKGKKLEEFLKQPTQRTLMILGGGILLGIVLGVSKGILDSSRGKKKNKSIQVISTLLPISIPDVLLIAFLQMLAVFLSKNGVRIFRVAGAGTFNHLILPILALSLLPAFYIARNMALSIDHCYQQDYVKAALGKGCSNKRVLWNHIMRNASGVIFESLSSITALIICNLMIVEYLFAYPGLSTWLMRFFREYYSIGIIAIAILMGLIYFLLDLIFAVVKTFVYRRLREGVQ